VIAALAAVVCLASPAIVPVEGRVVDWFRSPACPRCAGNRGLEFVSVPGAAVVAPVAGEVAFSGPVGGVGYIVIVADEPAGLNAVIGGVGDRTVAVGDAVAAGQRLGQASTWLFAGFRLGSRREAGYLDPAPLFGLGRRTARLVAPEPPPVSLRRRSNLRIRSSFNNQRHCSVLPPVVASARGPGP